jgi:pilus assembly protein CpaF
MTPETVLATVCSELASGDASGGAPTLERAIELARRLLPLSTEADVAAMAESAFAHVCGLGPLQRFLTDPSVNEVMVNNGGDVWIERDGTILRAGRLEPDVTPRVIERILSPLGRRLDRLSPIVDARLPDGSRVCAVIPPVAVDGPCLTLRRFGIRRRGLADFGDAPVVGLLVAMVIARCNVLISGATSSGKTSLLNALVGGVFGGPDRTTEHERIITLEDTAELQLDAAHVLRLETRPATVDGTPAVTMTDLVRAALRLRPDRLVVGEIRGAEVVDMLAAMNTGHSGSLSTCHANSTLDALRRVESLVVQHSPSWPLAAVRDTVHASLDVVVHVERTMDGRRQVTDALEVTSPGSGEAHRPLVVNGHVCDELLRRRA